MVPAWHYTFNTGLARHFKEKPMTEETAKKTERDPKDPELDKKENDELTHEELADVSGGFIVRQ
jgi:hypothetical protein